MGVHQLDDPGSITGLLIGNTWEDGRFKFSITAERTLVDTGPADADRGFRVAHRGGLQWAALPSVTRRLTMWRLAERLEQDRHRFVATLCSHPSVSPETANNEVDWAVEYARIASRSAGLPPYVPATAPALILASESAPLASVSRHLTQALTDERGVVVNPHPQNPIPALQFVELFRTLCPAPGLICCATTRSRDAGPALLRYPSREQLHDPRHRVGGDVLASPPECAPPLLHPSKHPRG